jgi:hypothetical protein
LPKVLIDGAGIAALTAAARLSKFKYEVFIKGDIDQNTVIDGYEFDHGQLLTLPAVFRDFFQKTGKHFGQVLEVEAKDPAFVFHFPDLSITFASLSRNARLAEIELKLGKDAASEWDSLLKHAEKMWDELRENYVEWEFSYLRANLPAYLQLRMPYVRNPYLRAILMHYATYLGYPAGLYKWSTLIAFAEESFGIWQIKGGAGALAEALKKRAVDLGTKFESCSDWDYYIDATQIHSQPEQRLLLIENYPEELPVRSVFFSSGVTADVYATKISDGKYTLVMTGNTDYFDKYAVIDQVRKAVVGNADDQLLTRIRTSNKKRFKVRHLDTLSHAGICGELLANAVRGVKNRPSHEH